MSGRTDYYMEKLFLINKQLGGVAKEGYLFDLKQRISQILEMLLKV